MVYANECEKTIFRKARGIECALLIKKMYSNGMRVEGIRQFTGIDEFKIKAILSMEVPTSNLVLTADEQKIFDENKVSARRNFIKKLRQNGMSIDYIVKFTELDRSYVLEVLEEQDISIGMQNYYGFSDKQTKEE